MDIKHQSLVLDINETRNYTLIKACQGDQKSRYIDCTLTQNGSVLSLTSNYRAIVKASINNEVKAINSCTIDTTSQVIVVELTSIMLDTPGILNCEITVQDGQQIVTSQAFAVQVRQSTIANETEIKKSKEYGALVDALSSIADVESKADKVQGLVDNIDKLESADDIINRLSTSETNIETNKASIKELSELVQEVKNSAIAEIESLKSGKLDKTDFNAYKTNNDTAVKKNATNIVQNATNIAQLDKSKANLVQSYNLFDWSILNGKTANGLTATATDDGGYHITGTPTKKYVSVLVKSISLENGEYYITSGKTTNRQSNCYSQITLVDKDKKETYYSEKSFTVSNENLSEIILSVQTGTLLNYIDVVLHPCLCKAKYKDNMPLSYNIERSTLELANQLQPYICNTMSNSQIKVTTDKSTSIVLNDSSDCNIVGLTLYGKSTQSAIPTPTNPVDINNINNPSITFSNDSDRQSNNIQCTLRGIGNVCDTLTVNSNGTGYITQRLFVERITSQRKSTSLEWNYSKATHRFFRNDYSYSFDVKDNKPLILCSHLDVGENEKNTAFDNSIGWINVSGVGIAIRMTEFDGDIAKFKKWLDDNEVYVVAPRSKPITVNLSKDEVDKILSLHTYYPSTKISADADFEATYIADTKNYIDSKFNELATAIVAHESEVM